MDGHETIGRGAIISEETLAQKSYDGMMEIYRMGILHAAFELRGTDSLHVSDEHLDWCARHLERVAENLTSPPTWPARA